MSFHKIVILYKVGEMSDHLYGMSINKIHRDLRMHVPFICSLGFVKLFIFICSPLLIRYETNLGDVQKYYLLYKGQAVVERTLFTPKKLS